MLHKSNRSIYHFLIFFLIILLGMFVMYYGLVKYHHYASRMEPVLAFDLDRLFKVNLFVIDLCVLVIAETLLIVLFYRYTLPSIGISTAFLVTLLLRKDFPLNGGTITRIFLPFVSTKYAFLGMSDIIVLIVLNTLLLSFLVTLMMKEADEKDSQVVESSKSGCPGKNTSGNNDEG